MKKYIALSLAVVMAFSLSSCGKKTEGKIELSQYKGLEVYESDIEVTKDELEEEIAELCEQHKKTETLTEGKVEETDTVNIDYVGSIKVDGKAYEFPMGSDQGFALDIDNNQFIDGFASGLVGKKVGEEVTLKLKFPDDYNAQGSGTTTGPNNEVIDLSGKKVTFKVTINSRDVETVPEFTDKFVKKNYGKIAKTKKELKEYVKEQMQISKFVSTVWENYSAECKVASYNSEEKESMISEYNDSANNMLSYFYSTNLETYLEACNKTKKDWDEKVATDTEAALKKDMIIAKIADENDLTVKAGTDEFKTLKKKYDQYNYSGQQQYPDNESLAKELTKEKVYKFVFDNKKVLEGERETEETESAETTEK